MVRIVETLVIFLLALLVVTEIFIPLICNTPLFGTFRKAKVKEQKDLNDKIAEAEEKIEEVKNVQKEADEQFAKSQTIKNKSDKLLNN